MNRARLTVALLVAALAVYLVLLAGRAITLIGTGSPALVVLGAAIIALPLLACWLVYAELRFAHTTERLARRLADEGDPPDVSHLPRRASGRVERAAADAHFADCRAAVEAAPEDWRHWYRLAQAYDLAGDRGRARETMRRAIDLAGIES